MSSDEHSATGIHRIIGIDLGTTKSGVSAWDAHLGRAVMIPDAAGRGVIPSLVGWDRARQEWVDGYTAKELAREHPADVIYSIKRYIGRWFHDPQVRNGRHDLTYRLVSGGGKDKLCDVIADLGTDEKMGPLQLSAPEVSAKVLDRLRSNCAQALGVPREQITEAIITVPAYFNMLQRQATILAGKKAGLTVVGILDEPIAAALAYGDVVLGAEERRILVYDLGGGTFDVAILEARRDAQGYEFFTRVIDGDTRLGGDDIDASVVRFLAEEIRVRFGHQVRPDDWVTRSRLRWLAEQAKLELSETGHDLAVIDLPALDLGSRSPFDARLELTRDQLEACAADVLSRTRAITERTVKEVAGLTWDQIDEVIMVGGQTLMPAIQRDVEAMTGHKPRVKDRPQLVVGLGAGEYAHILSLGKERFHENTLINVLALPVGIRLDDNTFKVLVEPNSTVPHSSRPYAVTTTEDNQILIHVEVLQGQRGVARADECVVLDSIDMDVPAAPARTFKFEVSFDVKSDGTMTVVVTDVQQKRTARKEIDETKLTWIGEGKPAGSGPSNT